MSTITDGSVASPLLLDSTRQGGKPAVHQQRRAKSYPLDIRNVGDDTYIVMSKGHHDPHEFMRAVRAHGYDWPLGTPHHKWMKQTPCGPSCGEHYMHYQLSDEYRKGWTPATYAWEDYGDSAYKPPACVVCGEAGCECPAQAQEVVKQMMEDAMNKPSEEGTAGVAPIGGNDDGR
jgi:hypothetical protein